MLRYIQLVKREQELLPVTYYHVVFTFSDKLNILCANHSKLMYNILFKSAWLSLKTMMGKEKWCGAQAGMLAVLHTWGQQLLKHVPLQLTMKMIKAIVKQKLGIDPAVCSYCVSANLVTEILEATPIFNNCLYAKNGQANTNRAPPMLPRHGLVKWVENRV